jgi:2-keto-4-pentenoate hydratase/2-oxohepta-3-ene-1,7-dioic acid hydratase in catechol pathway
MNAIQFKGEPVFPSKVVCVGRNYLDHIKELKNAIPEQPVIFIKPNSAVSDVLQVVSDEPVSYEAELSFLIRDNTICGIGFGLDLTKRAVQSALKVQGLPWERAKAFNGSALFSEFVQLNDDITELTLRLSINGNVVQDGSVKDMIHSPEELLTEAQTFLSFENNDVLMTGTPSGVGIVKLDDVFIGQVFQGAMLLIEKQWVVI